MNITMFGAGGWGTAMASQLALKHKNITLYSRNYDVLSTIKNTSENKDYLPGVKIPRHVCLTSDVEIAVSDADCVILATPSKAIEQTIKMIFPYLKKDTLLICTAKGLSEIGNRLSEIILQNVSAKTNRVVALSGPNHAEEVGMSLPAATVVASANFEAAKAAQDIYMLPRLRVYHTDDIIGVEYGGALKNIIALAAGALDGLYYGDNSKAALITRGLTEIARFGRHFGARTETFFGLSGMGDLVVTCTSKHSRNHAAGILLSQGKSADEIIKATNMVVEGIRTTYIVHKIASANNIDMPITKEVYNVLYEKTSMNDVIERLMNRAKKTEVEDLINDA